MAYIYRYVRIDPLEIYDRKTGKTIFIRTEVDRGDYYVVNIGKDDEEVIYKEDIDEVK